MSELYEKYMTLVGRGMPEMGRLKKNSHNKGEPWLLSEDDDLNSLSYIAEDDARDLLTMHALRWWLNVGFERSLDMYREFTWQRGVGRVCLCLDDGNGGGGDTPLDALVNATAYLDIKV